LGKNISSDPLDRFFLAAFSSGLLTQLGKGPHFALRFGAIALAVVAALPTLVPVDYAYLAGAVLLSIVSRVLDHLINGPLQSAGPWFSAASFDRSVWVRFALAYALASTVGLWIGIQSGSIRAVWISAITLVLMVPNVRTTYNRVFEGVLGTALAVGTVGSSYVFGILPAC